MIAEKKKTKSALKAEVVREELVRELKHLRGAVREAGENFILRREGEIETIISHLAAIPAAPLKAEAPGWLHDIRELKIKPAKGRLKDLKEIDELIEELADSVMSAQDGKKNPAMVRKVR